MPLNTHRPQLKRSGESISLVDEYGEDTVAVCVKADAIPTPLLIVSPSDNKSFFLPRSAALMAAVYQHFARFQSLDGFDCDAVNASVGHAEETSLTGAAKAVQSGSVAALKAEAFDLGVAAARLKLELL